MHENWHVLLIEDDAAVRQEVCGELHSAGYEGTSVSDARSALEFIGREGPPHLIVTNIGIESPDLDGMALARMMAERGVPMILTTADDSLDTALESLAIADDFVRMPYEAAELVARVRRVLSRIVDFSYATKPVIQLDERLGFDFANNLLLVEGEEVSLTPIESRLLHTLMQYRGRVVDNRTLIMRVWSSSDIYEDTLRVHIHRLRHKLEAETGAPKYIVTERGVGYLFSP